MVKIVIQHEEPYKRKGYRAYLLRCWQEGERWFFSLEEVSGERRRHGFPDLKALVAFLRREVIAKEEASPEQADKEA